MKSIHNFLTKGRVIPVPTNYFIMLHIFFRGAIGFIVSFFGVIGFVWAVGLVFGGGMGWMSENPLACFTIVPALIIGSAVAQEEILNKVD